MNIFSEFRRIVIEILEKMTAAGELPDGLDPSRVVVEPPRDTSHGDLTTNAAMVLAKPAGKNPREIAGGLAKRLALLKDVEVAEIAGPGFVNLRLTSAFWHRRLEDILRQGTGYGSSNLGAGEQVNVEYVSTNPTGPLHVGHGRGAVIGDVLAALLEKVGHTVTREYYINDAGAQVDALARSVHLRYRQALGEAIGEIPKDHYPGDYLIPAGKALAERDGEKWIGKPEEAWLDPVRKFAIDSMMDLIRQDLSAVAIEHDVFTSERDLADDGKVEAALKQLEDRGLIYTGTLEPPKGKKPEDWEPRPQTLFRATRFGDDVDRPLRKSDGSWTYFATDIAYHLDKFERGFASMIDVWGADHGGYVKRMKAAVKAITNDKGTLDVKLCQLVNLSDRGEPVRMSKRAGTFVSLRDVVDRVGKDVFRFIMLTRKNDAQLDFDFAKVAEQSKDNPVFYVQYAHARTCSVFRNAGEVFADLADSARDFGDADLSLLADNSELDLLKRLAGWPALLEGAAIAHEPHRLAYFMYELAAAFHSLWTKGRDEPGLRFIIEEDRALTTARLAMVRGLQLVIASGLTIFGVSPVEEMR
ncbi:MAG: arginine--tRNA ligase [Alphaproteobacteria bacterium]|nr:arginine--tRNA ligase [Alphaproteobacteria bacterium]